MRVAQGTGLGERFASYPKGPWPEVSMQSSGTLLLALLRLRFDPSKSNKLLIARLVDAELLDAGG